MSLPSSPIRAAICAAVDGVKDSDPAVKLMDEANVAPDVASATAAAYCILSLAIEALASMEEDNGAPELGAASLSAGCVKVMKGCPSP